MDHADRILSDGRERDAPLGPVDAGPAAAVVQADDVVRRALQVTANPPALPTALEATRIRRAATTPGASGSRDPSSTSRVVRSHDHRAVVGADGGTVPADIAADIRRSNGVPLGDRQRRQFEPAFGTDLSSVRVHRDSAAAPRLAARAFTIGNDIHVASGEPTSGDAGLRLMSHELAHVVQGADGAVARRILDPKAVLSALESSVYLKDKLRASTHVQARAAQPERMRARVAAILQQHEQMFAGDADADSLALALAMDGVASVIASELYDPMLKSKIADQLFTVYGAKIEAAIKKKVTKSGGNPAAVAQVAQAIAGGDPVSLYMHREMRLEEAALEVQAMAIRAGRSEAEMFDLLVRRFQSELASYTMNDVKEQEATQLSFNPKESSGERSRGYIAKLFGDVAAGDTMPKRADGKGLEFSADSAAKLAELKATVDKAAAGPLAYQPPANAQERRTRYLAEVQAADDAIQLDRTAALKQTLTADWKLSSGQADTLIAKLKSGLSDIPLTVTHWAGRRTANQRDGSAFSTSDVSRAGQTTSHASAGVIGKKHTKAKAALPTETLAPVGKYEDPIFQKQRGERYTQFRKWKDRLMTGNLGFADDELPVFGAANIYWDQTKGTGTAPKPGAIDDLGKKTDRTAEEDQLLHSLTAEWARLSALTDDQRVGINYYGDMHLKLLHAKVRDRIVYTAGDHGHPHRDPFLAFVDFVVGTTDTYRSDITELKDTKAPNNAKHIVNTILDTKQATILDLPFEIQIHGGVDWEVDVEEIWVSPGAPADAITRLDDWSKAGATRPPVRIVPKPDAAVTVRGGWTAEASAAFDLALQAVEEPTPPTTAPVVTT